MGNKPSSPTPSPVATVSPPAPPSEPTSAVAAPPPPLQAPGPTYSQEPQQKPQVQTQTPTPEPSTNPGTFEEFHKKCKDVFPQPFEGAKVVISKPLSSHFQVSHNVTMSQLQPSGYRFGATYIGSKQLSPIEVFPIFQGDMDVSGNLNAYMCHAFTDNLRSKLIAQFQGNKTSTQISTDYKGSSYTASATAAQVDLLGNSGILIGQYLQRVNSRLDVGSELVYQYGPQIPGEQVAILSLAARVNGEKWQLSGNVSPMAGNMHVCFYQSLYDKVQIGAELETSLQMKESTATIGYQVDNPNIGLTFRGQFDTNWILQATLEKKISEIPLPIVFSLSAMANQSKSDYKFGVGLQMG